MIDVVLLCFFQVLYLSFSLLSCFVTLFVCFVHIFLKSGFCSTARYVFFFGRSSLIGTHTPHGLRCLNFCTALCLHNEDDIYSVNECVFCWFLCLLIWVVAVVAAAFACQFYQLLEKNLKPKSLQNDCCFPLKHVIVSVLLLL